MALINKIREKSGFAVGAIAVGLLIFMVLGDLLGPNSRLLNRNDMVVGEIAGEEVTYPEFEQTLEGVKREYISRYQRQPTEAEMTSLRDQAWNQMIFKIAFQKEFDKLGMAVSDEELADMVQGNNVHPAIKEQFVNEQTGQFDRNKIIEYLRSLDKADVNQQMLWANFEASLRPDRMNSKFNNLIKKATYVTTEEAKMFDQEQNTRASMKYLFVPFTTIADTAVAVTDKELKDYLDKNKARYDLGEARSLEYVTFPVNPSTEDSATYQKEISTMVTQFRDTKNDSLFVKANSEGAFSNDYVSIADLPENLRNANLNVGSVHGPFAQGGSYNIYKVTDIKEGGTAAARASHILIKSADTDTPEQKAEAEKKAKDVLAQIKAGADFAEMAAKHGSDGTAPQGGDLGWFTEGRMVPEFEKAVFGANSAGLLPNLVKTQFGYHIIKVTEPKTTRSYQLATVTRNISSSDATRDAAYMRASELAGTSKGVEEFKTNVANDKSLFKAEAKAITPTHRNVNNLQNARELIRWSFAKNTNVGDVSPVFEIDNQFVVAVLTGKRKKGEPTVDDLREELTVAVRNEKKAETIMSKLKDAKGPLDQIGLKYGPEAQVKTADDVTFASNEIRGLDTEPVAVGKLFGLKEGGRTAPFKGEGGIIMVELTKLNKAPVAQDVTMIRKQMEGSRAAGVENAVYEAIKEKANIEDKRVKFF